MDNQNKGSNVVFDMINSYADQNDISSEDIFKTDSLENKEVIKPIRKDANKKQTNDTTTSTSPEKSDNGTWTPSEEDIAGLDELKQHTGVVYKKEEWKDHVEPAGLKNIVDDKVSKNVLEEMDELQRAAYNIESSKHRLGIKHLRIPTIYNSRIMDVAGDPNPERCAANLDKLLKEIIDKYPDSVIERLDNSGSISSNETNVQGNEVDATNNIQPSSSIAPDQSEGVSKTTKIPAPASTLNNNVEQVPPQIEETKIIIDKTSTPEIVFSNEDIDKVRKSRTVTLNIVETKNIEYSIIDTDDSNGNMTNIDKILNQYTRKMNDIRVSLPASRYRCSFTGLSYPEMLDLSYSHELNNLDGERKKWSIVFKHIKNPSIGEFKEREYTNENGELVRISAFEDFLRKTSFIDLEFCLWAILCATCLDKEIISITCHADKCNNTYEWLYDPKALIQMDSVPEVTLNDMKITGELQNMDDIIKHYNESMLNLNNSVKLPSSEFVLCFGHISAYDYLESRLADVTKLKETEDASVSSVFEASALTVIKYMLLPSINIKGYRKISNGMNIMKVIHTLDAMDCMTISEITKLMLEPYQFKFKLDNLVCPKCHTKSSIDLDDMSRLLFLIAQSLSNSEVKLIKS